jgi:hypothetical protein
MKIEYLYFEDCASWQIGLENLRTALNRENIAAEIEIIAIQSREQAYQEKFLGSPSYRVNGADLWHYEREGYDLGCRIYQTPNGVKGYPTVKMLQEKFREIQN